MSVSIFLGEPPAHIKQWIIDHPPMTEEPDPVDSSDWGKLVAALEDCKPSDFNGLAYVGDNELLTTKPVGSALGVQYKLDGTTPKTTRWINLGYNGSIPEYAKYRRPVGSGWRHVWVKTMKDSLLAPIAAGDAIYTRTFDVPTSEYSYEEYDVIESIGTGTFTYGNNCTWAVPLSFTTVGGKTYDFCGYNMTVNSEAILTNLVWDPAVLSVCVLRGTKITLADGSTKNVEDITYSDKLRCWNFDEGKLDSANIIWMCKPDKTTYCFKNIFKSGRSIWTSGTPEYGHRFFSLDANQFLCNTKEVGHKIMMEDGTIDTLLAVVPMSKDLEYYNIVTEQHFNCYANGYLASCNLNNMYSVQDMKYVKEGRTIRPYAEFEAAGVSKEWYDNFRLGEQLGTVEFWANYTKNALEAMQPK